MTVQEGRCPLDTPLSEAELETFDKFYRVFLNKKLEDKLSLLKSMSLVRRGDLRKYVQYAALFQKRYESLIPLKQRDLLLSFPSVNKEIYNLIFDCVQSYGNAGETAVVLTKDQVSEHLDRTEMFRIDMDILLTSAAVVLPESHKMLSEYFAESQLAPSNKSFKFVIVILADHAMLTVVPHTEKNASLALGQVRSYLEQKLGDRFEDNLIEFFVVGGGYLRTEGGNIIIGGRSLMFDPLFADANKPLTDLYATQFLNLKYQLAQQLLELEFPQYKIIAHTNATGQLQVSSI